MSISKILGFRKKTDAKNNVDQNFRISKKNEIVNPRWAPRNAPPRKMSISKFLGFPKKTDAKKEWTKILGFQKKTDAKKEWTKILGFQKKS